MREEALQHQRHGQPAHREHAPEHGRQLAERERPSSRGRLLAREREQHERSQAASLDDHDTAVNPREPHERPAVRVPRLHERGCQERRRDAARCRRQHEQHRHERRAPQQHRREAFQQHAGVRRGHRRRQRARRRKRQNRRTRQAHGVQQRAQRERRRTGQRRDQRERPRRHDRRRRRGEQAEQAVRAPQVDQQAQHARRQRHRAHRPCPGEELLRHGQRAPPQHAGALEHAQDGEGARSRSSQEKIACREHVEHAPPRPSSSPATPHCRNAAIHWYYSTARAKRTAKGRGLGMLRHTESKHAVVILNAAPKVRSRRIPRNVSWKSHGYRRTGSFDSLRSLRMAREELPSCWRRCGTRRWPGAR